MGKIRWDKAPKWDPPTENEMWHAKWVMMWVAIGHEVMRRAHPCPGCSLGNWLHEAGCKVADDSCWWCYKKIGHERWCLGVEEGVCS